MMTREGGGPVHSYKKLTYMLSIMAAMLIVGVGAGIISFHVDTKMPDQFPGTYNGYASITTIEDEEVSYGAAQVIGPIAGQEHATTAKVGCDGAAITFQYYNASGNSFTLQFSANGRTGTIRGIPVDNSTIRLPLEYGSGTYTITIMEMVGGGAARTVSTHSIDTGTGAQVIPSSAPSAAQPSGAASGGWSVDTSDPYLTPITDINWSEGLVSVKKARELCTTSMSDREKAQAVYNHLVAILSYNYDLVGKLPAGYTPSMDPTYNTKRGICYDFSSLYAGMMRSVGVKCKLVKGYNSMVDGYHAWNEVYVDGGWQRLDLTIDSQLRMYQSTYGFSSPQGTVTVSSSY